METGMGEQQHDSRCSGLTTPTLCFHTTNMLDEKPHKPTMSQLTKKMDGSDISNPLRMRTIRMPSENPPIVPSNKIPTTRESSNTPSKKPKPKRTRTTVVRTRSETPASSKVLTKTAHAGMPFASNKDDVKITSSTDRLVMRLIQWLHQ